MPIASPYAIASSCSAMAIDKDVLAWFRSQGQGYQTRMNAVLRMAMEGQKQARKKTTRTASIRR